MDQDGIISADDLLNIFEGLNRKEVMDVIDEVDLDRDGTIHFEEFRDAMKFEPAYGDKVQIVFLHMSDRDIFQHVQEVEPASVQRYLWELLKPTCQRDRKRIGYIAALYERETVRNTINTWLEMGSLNLDQSPSWEQDDHVHSHLRWTLTLF